MPKVSSVGIHIQWSPHILPLPIILALIVAPVAMPTPKHRKSKTTASNAMTRTVLPVSFIGSFSSSWNGEFNGSRPCHPHLSEDGSRFIDLKGYNARWFYRMHGVPEKQLAFPDAEVRIDSPIRSPDGRWLLFDGFRPNRSDLSR